jgi:hypothetical protein
MTFEVAFGKYDGKTTRDKIINYIKANYGEILGTDVSMLDEEDGLNRLRAKYFKR